MISTILATFGRITLSFGVILLNMKIDSSLKLSPILSFITWLIASGVGIITFMYMIRQFIKIGLDIKRAKRAHSKYKSKIRDL